MITGDASHDRGSWRAAAGRAATLLAHVQAVALLLALVTSVAYTLLDDNKVVAFFSNVFFVTAILAMLSERYHNRHLCLICASRTPLDGASEAEKNSAWLWYHHFTMTWPVIIGVLVFCAIGVIWRVEGFFYAVILVWVLDAKANMKHRPLEPWCPRCHWWHGDDDDETVDEPVPPAPVMQKS